MHAPTMQWRESLCTNENRCCYKITSPLIIVVFSRCLADNNDVHGNTKAAPLDEGCARNCPQPPQLSGKAEAHRDSLKTISDDCLKPAAETKHRNPHQRHHRQQTQSSLSTAIVSTSPSLGTTASSPS